MIVRPYLPRLLALRVKFLESFLHLFQTSHSLEYAFLCDRQALTQICTSDPVDDRSYVSLVTFDLAGGSCIVLDENKQLCILYIVTVVAESDEDKNICKRSHRKTT